MPIRIPDDLPAAGILKSENIFTMSETRASHQNIRPLRVLILNLMPKKIETETQLMRLLSNTPLQVDIELLRVDARASRNTPQSHLDTFYGDFERVKNQKWDGFIITGAPLGTIPFEEVYYWDKFTEILEWSRHNVTSTLFLCWAAQAAFKYLYGLEKMTRERKLSGIYEHTTHHHHHPLVRGFDDFFWAPLSRFAEFDSEYTSANSDLTIFADAPEAGIYLAASPDCRQVFITGHPEYDADTLNNEYLRDLDEGVNPMLPENYYPSDDAQQTPRATWRSHGNLLYSNWLNYCVYQVTPYDLSELI
ncbi:homoserine O-acetyltransferase MetA [Psychromonas antarctica]|jgi:homoserine O-succinyltransferase|uniref:homoserine O-acetyltransferase MetA n=1 Tax=Psychromonas antarctica TaxID=67573 RepID=UPI001EE8A879|nr:homoserine O-succinyltransferase [Psychromonas antarctica]MCG6200085.1 homoserine O-succinyltransferase [Psychromonas antarctica]